MKKTFIPIALTTLLLSFSSAWAGITGKITGVVTDAQSKGPLIGASVAVVGTQLGGVTDVNGHYTILNVPVGTYTLKFSSVGYSSLELSNVGVSPDLASYQDATLSSSAADIGKTIQVTSEPPLVVKDKTSSINVVKQEQLKALPLRGAEAVVGIQNSVVKVRPFNASSTRGDREAINGVELNLRGGRPSEIAYYVDGYSTQDPLTGMSTSNISNNAIKEISVISGGFPAEYGHVTSGIVNTITNSGSKFYKGNFEVVSDNVLNDNYNQNWYSGDLSGPIPGVENAYFFGAVERRYLGDRSPSSIAKEIMPSHSPILPNNSSQGWSYQGKLDFNLTPSFKLAVSGTGSKDEWREYRHSYLFNLPHIPYYEDKNLGLNTRATWTLSANTFVNLSGSYNAIERFRGDGVHRKNLMDYSLSETPGFEPTSLFFTGDIDTTKFTVDSLGDTTFYTEDEGSAFDDYLKRKSSYVMVKGDLNTLVNEFHTLKLGFEFQRHTLRYYNHLFPRQIAINGNFEDLDRYGYDSLGNEVSEGTDPLGLDGPKKPVNLALYLQDRFEWRGLIINGGVRYDYFDYKAKRIKNLDQPLDPDSIGPSDPNFVKLDLGDLEDSEHFSRISPRLGIAYPVSDKTQLHVNYGKFFQRPDLQRLYVGYQYYEDKVKKGGYFYPIGNPSLEPEKTTAYEIGITHQLGEYTVVDIAGFYRDVNDQVQVYSQAAQPTQYVTYRNSDYGTVKGLEFSMKMRRQRNIALEVRYSLQYANGTGSYANSQRNIAWTSANAPKQSAPLDYDQRHNIVGNIDWSAGKGGGPRVGELHPLENVGINVLLTASSGLPYSPQEIYNEVTLGNVAPTPRAPRNTSVGPWNFSIDLKAQKTFTLGSINLSPYLLIKNLLDRDNAVTVYESTGKPNNTGWLATDEGQTFVQQFSDPNRYGLTGEQMYELKQNDPTNYSNPRQFLFGLQMSF